MTQVLPPDWQDTAVEPRASDFGMADTTVKARVVVDSSNETTPRNDSWSGSHEEGQTLVLSTDRGWISAENPVELSQQQ